MTNSASAARSGIAPQTIPGGIGAAADLGPATPSLDHEVMAPYWATTRDLLVGVEAIRKGGEAYLPRHPDELANDYQYRLNNAKLTNIYADIIETLSAKPFDSELRIVDGSASTDFTGTPVMKPDPADASKEVDSGKRKGGLVEDIDGKGSHLHVFAGEVFYHGINAALDWIFVDYPDVPPNMTRAQEQALNIRPYWYRIPADMVLDVQSEMVGGKEVFTYFRFFQPAVVRSGYKMVVKERVREIIRPRTGENEPAAFGPPTWKVLEKDDSVAQVQGQAVQWKEIKSGVYSIGEIPVTPFVCGRRRGTSWVVDPPMKSAASLQIELYQQETGLKSVSSIVCYPMLSASGVNLIDDKGEAIKVTIGPHTVLCAPPNPNGHTSGEWKFIEPGAESLKFVASQIDATKSELRELGRQPLTAQSTNITVLTSAFASQKANSAIQAWAIRLKDALENALALTAKWMNEKAEPEVAIDLDFAIDVEGDGDTALMDMRKNGDLSRRTLWAEQKRRGKLGPDFDADQEDILLAEELPEGDEVTALDDPNNPPDPNNPDPNKPPQAGA